MDRNERIDNPVVAMQAMLRSWQVGIRTGGPGILQSFDHVAMTCKVQPAIQAKLKNTDGTLRDVSLPILVDVPVIFPSCKFGMLTFPLVQGDEGYVLIADRCIDAWWQQGGIQPMAEIRLHDLSDGCFLPGMFSQPNVPPNVSANTMQLRSFDGAAYLEIAAGGVINVKAPGGFNAPENFTVTGALAVTGAITATQSIRAGGQITAFFGTPASVTVSAHTHAANGAPPTPGT